MVLPGKILIIVLLCGFLPFALMLWNGSLAFLVPVFYAAVVVLCAVDFFTIPRKNGLHLTRTYDKYLSIGARNPVKISLENVSGRHGRVRLRDEYPTGFSVGEDTLRFSLNPFSTQSGTYHVQPLKKGEYEFGRLFLKAAGRMGLVERRYIYTQKEKAFVYPNLIEFKKYLHFLKSNRLQQIGYKKRTPGGETEFDFLREYQSGDEYRKINWKATAKKRFPIVEVDEQEYNRNVVVILDTGRMMTTRYDELSKLDYAVDATLMLAGATLHNKDCFGMLAFSRQTHVFIPPSRQDKVLTEILSALYRTTPDFSKSDYEGAYIMLKRRLRKNSILFIFSELFNAVTSRELILFLKMLSSHHRIAFISFEESEEEAKGKSLYDITRWAIQQKQVVEKESVIREFSKAGIRTIRVNASNIKQKVVNFYTSL
ncbi:MAG: DUF58 domain-containing protein [Spirochaetales bacterium]|nr:DUF58 domain-containing protein [Spirochaetales bacterium]